MSRMQLETKRIRFNSGQALVELAIFGSLLLFVLGILVEYGLSMNYQQNTHMQAFRLGLKRAADDIDDYRNKNMRTAGSQYIVVRDKPIPNPQDPLGIPDRRQFSSSAGITWSSGLDAYLPTDDAVNNLPRRYYDRNDSSHSTDVLPYTVADFFEMGNQNQHADDDYSPGNYHGDEPFQDLAQGDWVDVDNDGSDEQITLVVRNIDFGDLDGWNNVRWIKGVDYQTGQINPDNQDHGLQQDYTRQTTVNNASLQNFESYDVATSTTTLTGVEDIFTRTIGTRSGNVTITSTLTPPIPSARWETHK